MINKHVFALTLSAALAFSACQAEPEPQPINPDSKASFGIHMVLHNADGSLVTTLPERLILGDDVELHETEQGAPMYIRLPPVIDKTCLKDIRAVVTESSRPALSINLTADCAKKFGRLTARNVGKRLALTIDGQVIAAPHILTAITAGGVMIDGGFDTLAEAEAVARQFY